jgi:hypothetical protein
MSVSDDVWYRDLTENHWVSGLCPSSDILKSRKLDLFPSLGEGMETPTLLCPTEGANLSHWTAHAILTTAI